MEFNILQQLGFAGAAGGAIMLFIQASNMELPKIPVNGGMMTFRLPDSAVLGWLILGGLVLMVIGTAWNVIFARKGKLRRLDEE